MIRFSNCGGLPECTIIRKHESSGFVCLVCGLMSLINRISFPLNIRRTNCSDTLRGQLVTSNWTVSQENLSSRFPTKRVSNQSSQLQRLARKLKFTCSKSRYDTF